MRCKCGYNSFDHNRACPKCRKDVSAIRRQLNLTMPEPGPTDFFTTASQRSVYPEPLLGEEGGPGQPMGLGDMPFAAPFAAGAAAAAAGSPFGGIPSAPDAPFGGIPTAPNAPFDAPAQPYGAGGPFGGGQPMAAAPPFGAPAQPVPQPPFGQAPPAGDTQIGVAPEVGSAMVDDIFPVADDSLDDIVPIEDEIVPIEEEITPVPHHIPQAAAVEPAEEIEVELDAFEDSFPTPAPAPQSPMAQIKNTLAETGDLAAQAVVEPALEVFDDFAAPVADEVSPADTFDASDFGQSLDLEMESAPADDGLALDGGELSLDDSPLGLDDEAPLVLDDGSELALDDGDFQLDAQEDAQPYDLSPPAAVPGVMAAESLEADLSPDSTLTGLSPQPQAEGDDLSSLVDELDLDKLDGDL